MKQHKRLIANVLMFIMVFSLIFPLMGSENVEGAKKKPKFSTKSITLTVKQNKTIQVKNAKKAKFTWKSGNKKYVTVKKSSNGKAKVTGVKKGNSYVTCKVKIGKKTYNLKCTVQVKAAPKKTQAPTATPKVTQTPTNGDVTLSPSSTPSPTPTAEPTTEPTEKPETLLAYLEPIFGNVGNCLSYNGGRGAIGQLQDNDTMEYVKKNYNSFSLENEMKPNAILGNSITKITREQALEKGYVIPSNYTEDLVPQLNFTTIDNVMKTAYDNGLRMRAHTLVWHSQSPNGFFRNLYGAGNAFVSKEVMDARMEFYIRNVMKHVYDSEYGSLVYSWDVVNEYLNANEANWLAIYGNEGTSPSFVKKAFTIAKDVLKEYHLENEVSLVYNDFNTYYNDDKIVDMIKFINSEGKVCDGVGMQSHLDAESPSMSMIGSTIDKFKKAGFEIQITELDVTINFHGNIGHTNANQAVYFGNFIKLLIQKKKAGANITGITWWGLSDNVSWRSTWSPTLFGTSFNDPKPSFYAVMDAAKTFYE